MRSPNTVLVAYALVRAASALMPTFVHEVVNGARTGVETSLDAARTSAYATILLVMVALPAAAQSITWKTEIDNSLVRVARRLVAARETVSIAEMPPALLVFLTDYSVRLTIVARQEEQRGKPGEFRWHSGGRIGLENLSNHPVEVMQVAPKFSPAPAGVSATLGRGSLVFQNDLIYVKHMHRKAGPIASGPPPPDQLLPAVAIHLSAAHIRFTHANGLVEEFRIKSGDIRFESGHAFSLEILGEPPEIELLRIILLKPGKQDRE